MKRRLRYFVVMSPEAKTVRECLLACSNTEEAYEMLVDLLVQHDENRV